MTKFDEGKLQRTAQLRWVPVNKMRILPEAQRNLNQGRVDKIAASFNPELVDTFIVNERDGVFWVIDGQHREAALEQLGMGDFQVQSWVYVNLTDEEMAELFLGKNDQLAVDSFTRFRVGVAAGRTAEVAITKVVESEGLVITRNNVPGAVQAVAAMRFVYNNSGAAGLRQVIITIRDTLGDMGFREEIIRGLGLLYDRYDVDHGRLATRLAKVHGGASGILGRAMELRLRTGRQKSHCVAAALVEIYNRGRGPNLPSWWKVYRSKS